MIIFRLVSLIIELASGAAGGSLAGYLLKRFSLGPLGNAIAGILGGGIGGQLLGLVTRGGVSAYSSGLDIGSILFSVLGGGVGGGLLLAIYGLFREAMASKSTGTTS